jgi:hypothetical protein
MISSNNQVLAIAAPVRCEARYLLEWIAYHRMLGIEIFLLADNGGWDHTSKLLQDLSAAGIVLRFDWRDQWGFQMAFYGQMLQLAASFIDGLFLIDVDEFLRPDLASRTGFSASVEKWLADPGIGAVALNWAIYGSSNRVVPGTGLVIERFTHRAAKDFPVNRHAKTFVKPAACEGPADNPHAVILRSGRYTDTRGEDVIWDTSTDFKTGLTARVTWDFLRVDHFVVKSHSEFIEKQARGSLLTKEVDWNAYFALHDRNDVFDPVSTDLVSRTKSGIAELTSQVRATSPNLEWPRSRDP